MPDCSHTASGITRIDNGQLTHEVRCDTCNEVLASMPGERYDPKPLDVISPRYRAWMAVLIARASVMSEAKASVLAPSRGGKPGSVVLVSRGVALDDRLRRRFGSVRTDTDARKALLWAFEEIRAVSKQAKAPKIRAMRDRILGDHEGENYRDVAGVLRVSAAYVWKVRTEAGRCVQTGRLKEAA